MNIDFVDLKAQYREYKSEIDSEVLEVFSSAEFIRGEKLTSLEKNLVSFTEADHAICCGSGTDALMLSLVALNIGHGDEVITTPFASSSTAEVISLLGAHIIFVDIDEENYNIDPVKIRSAITEKTKVIIPVSLFGQCADMDSINSIAKEYDLPVIEDASQSFGATYNGKKSCNLSTIGYTSFYPSKPLGAYGNGGAVFTNDEELAAKIRALLENKIYGYLDEVQAAVLGVKLKYFDNEIKLRDEIGTRYNDLLEDANVITPKISESNICVFSHYSIRVEDREAMMEKLRDEEIPTIIYYSIPLHLQEAFKKLGYNEGNYPVSEKVSSQIMSLPMSAFLTEEEQDFIVHTIKS
ncbi:DegT/DnrJ/EryC1/StrS family aminotransferase [Candidatus Sulfurimonas marisnigri]|uniref:DegT/DnrJ/EryC1/StrS family aminotransferase n=1 Tax=Candidatus Sulfurimonas marisnigri TaxID=2740405 RepID=A0A7S7RQQ0_9BACT|nr:DegT/DnrJ/EryC1/StrS family aminotransferase [Candidatus Sulfurimonas marisnigri]QOY55662.1 DegT/DnrJ/EryC1/StrS family aminotransferase [Candidatus Sulfurimonas marisnigri]